MPPTFRSATAYPFSRVSFRHSRSSTLVAFILVSVSIAASGRDFSYRSAFTVADVPYLQEVGRKIPTDFPCYSVAVHEGNVYVGTNQGLYIVSGAKALARVEGVPEGVIKRLVSLPDALYVFLEAGLGRWIQGRWELLAEGDFTDAIHFRGQTVVASPTGLYTVRGSVLEPLPNAENSPLKILRITEYAENIYCLGYDRVFLFDGKEFQTDDVVDFGQFPSKDLRDVLARGNHLVIATHHGLGILRGSAATAILGEDGLPVEETKTLAEGFDGEYWIGTPHGAIRAGEGFFHYFAGQRWLPDDHVNSITVHQKTVYIATNGGLGIIEYTPFTLFKKALYYEKLLQRWNLLRMAFVHKLEWDDETQTWMREVSDNDVGWSTHYWASQAFKYAVTQDPAARQAARDGFNAMKWSEEITGIPGFPARSIWAVGETAHKAMHGSGGYPAEWHATPDGLWEWKGDTSSDELDAHYYYAAIFYELAATPSEKEKVREHVRRITQHLIEHNYTLCDVDGLPTRWGRWDPEYFASLEGSYAKGLNGLEALTYVRTAHALTGENLFAQAYQTLCEWGYPQYTLNQKHTFPVFINHSDDRLAFYCYHTLLAYETDPYLRGLYRRSLERSWEIDRIENNPWFNFIYGARTGNRCEENQAVEHLRAWPLDLVEFTHTQQHRRDSQTPRGYLPYAGGTRAYSPRERGPLRWSNTTLSEQSGTGGRTVADPSGWLDAYWMGRYYGFISPPQTEQPELLTVSDDEIPLGGAAPYDGPPMPDFLGTESTLPPKS